METQVAKNIEQVPEAVTSRIEAPEGYAFLWAQEVEMDGERVWHLRFETEGSETTHLGGEHYSAVVTPEGNIKGTILLEVRLSGELAEADLPSEERAQEVALSHLQKVAPDLLESMDVRWVAGHGEKLIITYNDVAGGLEAEITGMKVKCQNTADESYFWVIVGPGEAVITFERDVVWDLAGSRRQTEMWLHDLWLVQRAPRG